MLYYCFISETNFMKGFSNEIQWDLPLEIGGKDT